MSNGIMVAVWGSKGCGKTTTAVKIATHLAALKKETILILTDIMSPDLNVLMPERKDLNTMGHLWSTPDCSMDSILKACNVTESKYLAVLSFKSGDNIFSYSEYTKENIMDIFMKLKNMAEYIVVDCVEAFPWNVLTTVSLELADKVIRLGEATLKSFSFYDSNLHLLKDSRYKVDQHYKVLAKFKSNQAKNIAISHFGGVQAELPYVTELEKQMLEGELFKISDTREMKPYEGGIQKILHYIEGTEVEETQKESNAPAKKLIKKDKNTKDQIKEDKSSKGNLRRNRNDKKSKAYKKESSEASKNLKNVRSAFKSRKKEAS